MVTLLINLDPARSAIFLEQKIKEFQEHLLNIYECRLPVIVGTHRLCIGAGMDLICGTDIRYSTKDWYNVSYLAYSQSEKLNLDWPQIWVFLPSSPNLLVTIQLSVNLPSRGETSQLKKLFKLDLFQRYSKHERSCRRECCK